MHTIFDIYVFLLFLLLEKLESYAEVYSATQINWVENNNIWYTKETLIKPVIEVVEEVDTILTNRSKLYIYVHSLWIMPEISDKGFLL